MTTEGCTPSRDGTEREAIRAFILSRFPLAKDRSVGDDDSLLDGGIVDSLGILDIVGFLEDRFEIQVGDDDLSPENFGSVSALCDYVGRKRA